MVDVVHVSVIAVEGSETAHYFYEKMLATCIRRSFSRLGVDSFVPRSFRHFAYSTVESIHHSSFSALVFCKEM